MPPLYYFGFRTNDRGPSSNVLPSTGPIPPGIQRECDAVAQERQRLREVDRRQAEIVQRQVTEREQRDRENRERNARQRQAEQEHFQAQVAIARTALSAYTSRPKNLLEQVLKYTSFGIMEGCVGTDCADAATSGIRSFWVSGQGSDHRCILRQRSLFVPPAVDPNLPAEMQAFVGMLGAVAVAQLTAAGEMVVDIREIDQAGFRVIYQTQQANRPSQVGDERTQISTSPNAVLERLQTAWALAFRECPSRRARSPF
jgi:hypothetical protein